MNAITQPAEVEIINHLPLDLVQPDPNQPRKIFDPEKLDELATSIKVHGVMQPILVRIDDSGQVIIKDGERRHRASQLAGKETIPTITVPGDRTPIDILIDQVACNQHEELKPMEMAEFFNALVDTHLVRVKDIPALLEKRGLKKMERSYISNMRRLVGLPDWAKTMINNGTLTPSHGKHILQASDDPRVMSAIQTFVEPEILDGTPPAVAELANEIPAAYDEFYRDIRRQYGEGQALFDTTTCDGCKTCKKFTTPWGRVSVYCLDETCYDKKQAEAREKKSANKPAKGNDGGTGSNDDHWKPAEKQSQSEVLKNGRIEKTQLYLDAWLRVRLAEHLPDDEATLYAILLWVGANAPGNEYDTCHEYLLSPDFEYKTQRHGINITLQHKIDHGELLLQIVDKTLVSMTRKNLRYLAHHCGIQLEGHYRVNAEYLTIKSKQELIDTTPEVVRDSFDDWTKESKKPGSELVDTIITRDTQYGIPADLDEFYEASKP